MARDNTSRIRTTRRRLVETTGLGGAAVVAGCLGDDEEPVDDVDADGVDDVDDVDDTDPADDTDDVDDVVEEADDADGNDEIEEEIERYDVAPFLVRNPPMPGDVQYHRRGWDVEPLPSWIGFGGLEFSPMTRSFADSEVHGILVDNWTYEPGIVEFTFRDDFYWWNNDVVNAEDWVLDFELDNWTGGGEDLDAYPDIIATELIDDQTVRISLADTWREDWALQQTLLATGISTSRIFNEPWLEQFDDTGGDMDAVEDVRDELASYAIKSGEHEEDLLHQAFTPFEFRLDGSLGEIGDTYWELELVPEKNGQQRRFADEINYDRWHVIASEDYDTVWGHYFVDGDMPISLDWENAEAAEFPTRFLPYQRVEDRWAFTFNNDAHPSDNPHFRRAWLYATDRTLWEEFQYPPQEHVTPFLSDERLERVISEDLIAMLTDYGKDEVMWDDAEHEMEIGGFERDADGNWLNQESGEPIEIGLGVWNWIVNRTVMGDTDFTLDMDEFGIDVEIFDELYADDPWRVVGGYTGGLLPEMIYDSIYGEDALSWGAAPNPNLPESVEAPPVGEADASRDDWIEYDTRTMTDRLGVTVDDEAYRAMVDELTWIANQVLPRATIVGMVRTHAVNDYHWHVKDFDDYPELLGSIPNRRVFNNGALSYVPEEER